MIGPLDVSARPLAVPASAGAADAEDASFAGVLAELIAASASGMSGEPRAEIDEDAPGPAPDPAGLAAPPLSPTPGVDAGAAPADDERPEPPLLANEAMTPTAVVAPRLEGGAPMRPLDAALLGQARAVATASEGEAVPDGQRLVGARPQLPVPGDAAATPVASTPQRPATAVDGQPTVATTAVAESPSTGTGPLTPRAAPITPSPPGAAPPAVAGHADAGPVVPAALAHPLTASALETAPPAAPPAAAPAPAQPGPVPLRGLATPLLAIRSAGPGEHVVSVSIAPAHLGPITVRAVVTASSTQIELITPSDAARDAVRAVLAEVRRELGDASGSWRIDVSTQSSAERGSGDRRDASAADHRGEPTGPASPEDEVPSAPIDVAPAATIHRPPGSSSLDVTA